jgi:hypothetical protein
VVVSGRVVYRDCRGGDVLMVATYCETSPDYYYSQCQGRDTGLDVGDTKERVPPV